ncbi:MAG: ZIP family metal transporter [Blastocatellales bacterium]
MRLFIQLLSFGLLAATGNLLGGFLLTSAGNARHILLKQLIALGAGFMLATVFLEIIPETAKQWDGNVILAMGWLVGGYLLIQLIEHTLAPHFHFGEEVHKEEIIRRGAATSAVIALSIHTFFDGVAISSGLLTNFQLGVLLFVAILLHKIPEGFTVASIMLSSGKGVQSAQKATILIALSTVAGILSVTLVQPVVRYALPLSAGVTLYVAASDLIPEVNHSGWRVSAFVFVGFALFYLLHQLLHLALG